MKFKIILFALLISINYSFSRDTSKFKKQDIIDVSWKYIQDTKKELIERARAVEEEIGEKVELNFKYFNPMSPDQQKIHQEFLSAKLDDEKTTTHIKSFLHELELNRRLLAEAEKKAQQSWEKKNANRPKTKEEYTEAELYGTKIKSKNLGVVLDRSHSMSKYLPVLREEIKKNFPNAYFIEIYGSAFKGPDYKSILHWIDISWNYITPNESENPFLSKWYCQSIPQENPHYFQARLNQDNIGAMVALSEFRKVDAIYWFSDMKDRVDSKPVEHLKNLLKKNKTKLYAHTVGKHPTRALSSMVKATGGKVIKKRLD